MSTIKISGSPYEFSMTSDPEIITFRNMTFRAFPEIKFGSSIFDFYSDGKVIFNDAQGLIVDLFNYVEGLVFKIKLGDKDTGYFENNYVWSENQLKGIGIRTSLGGTNLFRLLSNYYALDYEKSKAWKNSIISDNIRQIALNNFKVDSTKIKITTTLGQGDYPQQNEWDKDYIIRLANISYDKNNPKSPFFTFFNSLGEFYFMSLDELLSQQPVEEFSYTLEEGTMRDPFSIKDSELYTAGMPQNRENYQKKIYSLDDSGSYSNSTENIEDYSIIKPKEKLLIRQSSKKVMTILDLGIMEKPNDSYIKQGKINASFKKSAFSLQLPVVIQFHPKCTAGHVIKLKIKSQVPQKKVSSEYSGNWLILSDTVIGGGNGEFFQKLLLGKSAVQVDPSHVITDFIY